MNYEALLKDIISDTIKIELVIDRAIMIGSKSIIDEDGYVKVCEIDDEEKNRVLLKRGEDYYYLEKEFCADIQQTGSCNYQYEKLYKVILNAQCKCFCP